VDDSIFVTTLKSTNFGASFVMGANETCNRTGDSPLRSYSLLPAVHGEEVSWELVRIAMVYAETYTKLSAMQ
jgi:hypothetical protein